MMNCDCKDWAENIGKVNAPILLQAARNPLAPQYDGKRFMFCPWCGDTLKDQPIPKNPVPIFAL